MPAVISNTVLVLAEAFEEIAAEAVAAALARGLESDGRLRCAVCTLSDSTPAGLAECGFDERMRTARALVIAAARLDDRTLAGSAAFEAATRARQKGVPAYAVTAHDRFDPFEARIVDLQLVLEAGSSRALAAAGRRLAAVA
jgi:hypothetical protein